MVTVVYCSRVVTVEWEIVHGNKLNLPCDLTGVIQTQNVLYIIILILQLSVSL